MIFSEPMSNVSHPRPSLLDALSAILPTLEETLLLRACLYSGESARQAWEEWQSHRNEFTHGSIGYNGSIKKVGLLVFNALRSHGLELDKENQTFLRLAYLKEELRSKIFRRICCDVLLLLANEGIPTIVLKGTALAETVYDNPVFRHCHDIDILIGDEDMSRAASLLPALGFSAFNQRPEPKSYHFKLEHQSGLPLELHTRLFQIPYHNTLLTEMWKRSHSELIVGVPARTLAASDALLHVCGHAFYSEKRESLRWVTDAWFLIDRRRDLDWDLLLECTRRTRLLLPLSVTLGYLAESLNAAIPSTFLSRLFDAAARTNASQREFALFGARFAPGGGFRNLVGKATGWRGRAFVIQWMLFPSPTYLLWVQQIQRLWLLPFHYVSRPLRYIARRIRFILVFFLI